MKVCLVRIRRIGNALSLVALMLLTCFKQSLVETQRLAQVSQVGLEAVKR